MALFKLKLFLKLNKWALNPEIKTLVHKYKKTINKINKKK